MRFKASFDRHSSLSSFRIPELVPDAPEIFYHVHFKSYNCICDISSNHFLLDLSKSLNVVIFFKSFTPFYKFYYAPKQAFNNKFSNFSYFSHSKIRGEQEQTAEILETKNRYF